MKLIVTEINDDTPDVKIIAFRHPRRSELPLSEPGSHVDVHIPGGKIRQYSLCGDTSDRAQYRIAVRRKNDGRGGSKWLHDNVELGMILPVTAPRSNFPIVKDAKRQIFVAGGIGITPFISMIQFAKEAGQDYALHYAAPTRNNAPLIQALEQMCSDNLYAWFSQESPGTRFDAKMLGAPMDGTHIYCCGPTRLVDSVRAATVDWPASQVHFEVFEAALDENFKPEPFDIRIASTGEVLRVPANESALTVLKRHGLAFSSSCEMGVCGSCVCKYNEGVVVHRDTFLDAGRRQDTLALCVSRARVAVTLDV
jgi:ferredoxin-NADP reductase